MKVILEGTDPTYSTYYDINMPSFTVTDFECSSENT